MKIDIRIRMYFLILIFSKNIYYICGGENNMEYILLNLTTAVNSIVEDELDNKILKEAAYGFKYKTPKLVYGHILLKVIPLDEGDLNYNFQKTNVERCISMSAVKDDILYTIYKNFYSIISKGITIDIVGFIPASNIEITYSDGSSSRITGKAGYGVCALREEVSNGQFDDFSKKNWKYDTYSGCIENGTNNVGELSGVKKALDVFGSKTFQVVISDNIYSIKTYREYVHVWKNNGWKAYNKKPIKNMELIKDTYNSLLSVNKTKVVLFKWTKGHAGDNFNELCDELAKKESGVK